MPKITCHLYLLIIIIFFSNGCSNSVEEVSQPLVDKTAPTTVATPPTNTYTSAQSVSLTCSDSDSGCQPGSIFYSTDINNTNFNTYNGPITIDISTSLRFYSEDNKGNRENIKTQEYTIDYPPVITNSILSFSGDNNNMVITWDPASDELTNAAALEYQLYYSNTNTISSVVEINNNGTAVFADWTNSTSTTVTSTAVPNATNKYWNVVVRDGNGSVRAYSAALPSDVTPPMATDTNLTFTGNHQGDFTLQWQAATDDITPGANLEYQVYYSSLNNINTINDITVANNGTAYGNWATNTAAFVTQLDLNNLASLYWNILVRDGSGNLSVYTSSLPTDIAQPVVSDNLLQFGDYDSVTGDFSITWQGSTDETSAFAALQYQLYYSTTNNISTLSEILSNGSVYNNFSTAKNSLITGLPNQRDLYWNVVVSDEAGNLASYADSLPVLGLGILDTSFTDTGYFTHSIIAIDGSTFSGSVIAFDLQGRILVSGIYTGNNGIRYQAVWRLHKVVSGKWELDRTFNSTGFVNYNISPDIDSNASTIAITIDTQGRILVAGSFYTTTQPSHMFVTRLSKNGNGLWGLDLTFTNTGYFVHDNTVTGNVTNNYPFAMTLDSSGKIVITGTSAVGDPEIEFSMTVWRLSEQTDGKWDLDTTFTNTGFFRHRGAAGGNSDVGYAMTIDKQGKILVAGQSLNTLSNSDMTVWRLAQINNIWQLDTSFNNTGYFTHNNAAGADRNDSGLSITTDNNDRILIAGKSQAVSPIRYNMVIWRLSSDNQQNWGLDQTFNGVGYLAQPAGNSEVGKSIVTDTLGRVVVAGNSGPDFKIWQYKRNTSNQWGLDSDFDGKGFISFPGGSASEILLDPQNRIFVSGSVNSETGIWSFR